MFGNTNDESTPRALFVILSSIMLALLGTACSPSKGAINGHVIGADTREPLQDISIILCLVPDLENDDYVCTLQGMPPATTDTNGAFVYDDIPPGSYILTYVLADVLVANPDEWGGVTVNAQVRSWDASLHQFKEMREGAFWQDGQISLGNIGVVTASGNRLLLKDGSVKSNHFGIWITAENGELAPLVQVQAGETTDLSWQVNGR
jgi:hypothetical protein